MIDHNPILIAIYTRKLILEQKYLDDEYSNWALFKEDINNNIAHTAINSPSDMGKVINNLVELILSSTERHIPKNTTVCSPTSNLSPYILLLIRLKNYFRRLCTKKSDRSVKSCLSTSNVQKQRGKLCSLTLS